MGLVRKTFPEGCAVMGAISTTTKTWSKHREGFAQLKVTLPLEEAAIKDVTSGTAVTTVIADEGGLTTVPEIARTLYPVPAVNPEGNVAVNVPDEPAAEPKVIGEANEPFASDNCRLTAEGNVPVDV
jgi:hypothetical protein